MKLEQYCLINNLFFKGDVYICIIYSLLPSFQVYS